MSVPKRKASNAAAALDLPTSPSSSHLLSFPRSASPSGIQGFLTKSARWLSRTTSVPKPPPTEMRPRLSGSSRRPTISGPSDPRPILTVPGAPLGASQSVLDLSAPYGLERIEDSPTPSVLGDLNVATGRTWSRSVDDLSSFASSAASRNASKAMVDNYRSGSASPARPPSIPFPLVASEQSPSEAASSPSPAPKGLPHSPSSPTFTFRVNGAPPKEVPPTTHNRSKSQGAHHAGHLKASTPVPPSPPPKSRSKTEGAHRQRTSSEKVPTGSGFSGLPAFPFHFGGSSHHLRGSPVATPSPEPSASSSQGHGKAEHASASSDIPDESPVIARNPARNSQIVHASGFVNRLNLSSKFGAQNIEKGWKPFKAELKGTKLLFYKPPHDRTSEIKDLFLTGPPPVEIPVSEPEPVEDADIPESGSRSRLRDRKRTYWGRARHTELAVAESGEVLSGPPEALIHELVFATALKPNEGAPPAAGGTLAQEPQDSQWRDFAVAVLLCLPSYMEKLKFEMEVSRVVNSFDRGATDEEKLLHRPRLRWLLEEYVRLHGRVEDEADWKSIVEMVTPLESADVVSSSSSSTAKPANSLAVPSGTSRPPVHRGASGDSVGLSKLASMLSEEGLSRDTLTRLDPRKVAESLALFQRSQLRPVHAADFLVQLDNDVISSFSGSEDHPNWLTRLVMDMILGQVSKSDSSNKPDEGGEAAGSSRLNSATYVRAGMVSRWIQIGERCRVGGDACSWRAIMAGLCCIPVARLEKVWRRVDETERKVVEDWVRGEKGISGDTYSPWADSVRQMVAETLDYVRVSGQPSHYKADVMVDATMLVETVCKSWDLSLRTSRAMKHGSSVVNALLTHWEKYHADPSPRITSINQSLSLSFAIEPRQGGRYQPNFWKPPTGYGATQSILPLLFPQPLPTISLLDRNALIRAKKEILLGPGIGLDEAQIQKITHTTESKPSHHRTLAETELDETLVPCFNGELVLKLPRDDLKSRPVSIIDSLAVPSTTSTDDARFPTRGNSIRLSPAAARLERKSSQIRMSRRSSLPSISQRNSLLLPDGVPSETHIKVTIKSGTVDRLVDVLVSGLEGVSMTHSDDNGEMPLRDGKSKAFKVDRAEFARVWWSGFRSFVTPIVLFELLRKRYGVVQSSKSVAFSTAKPTEGGTATNQLRLNVLSTLSYWLTVGGGSQDVLDDLELYLSIRAFLSAKTHGIAPDVEKARASLYSSFLCLVSRPSLDLSPVRESRLSDPTSRKFGVHPPAVDAISPEDLVDNLDSIAQTVFRGVTELQMFVLADILEAQTADRTGWFLARDPVSTHDGDVVIQELYSHLQQVEPSVLVAAASHHDHLYKLLSPSIRTVIRAHSALRDWAALKIADPSLQPAARVARMTLLIKALEVCRSKALDGDLSSADDGPAIRSFVEGTLVAAVLSPESRMYARSWNEVASSRSGSVEDLVSLIGKVKPCRTPGKPLTVDPAWIMERMVEIITLSDVLEAPDAQTLVNFDKRRYLHNLIVNTAGLSPRSKRASDTERQDMERLNAMSREAQIASYDARSVREAAQREMAHLSFNHGKRLVKPFYQLVALQQEKSKRDKYLRDKLFKEKKTEQLRSDKRASLLNKAMQPQKSAPGPKHLRQKRSVSSMYSLFRPLSVAFGAAEKSNSWEGPRRTAAELDFPATNSKGNQTLNLVGAGIRVFINDQRPFTLQLDTEDGAHVLIQAVTAAERDQWLKNIKKVADTSAMKRLTYLGRNAIPAYNELVDFSVSGPADPTGVFGHDILAVLKRESPTGEYIPGSIPRIVDLCIQEVERRGLTEVGLHRIAGSKSQCDALRAEFNRGNPVDLSLEGDYPDIHIIAGVLRQWFRELPESVFTNKLYTSFIESMKIPDYDERKATLRTLIWQLPLPNFNVLRRLLEHLDHVCDYEESNQMTPDSLAICFNMTLCKPPSFASFNNMTQSLSLVKHCIIHYHYIFSEADADADHEDAIAEEPEEEEGSSSDDGVSPAGDADPSSPNGKNYLGSSLTLQASATETSFFTASDGGLD